jgi:hypothetical protein
VKSFANKRPFLVYTVATCLMSWGGLFGVLGTDLFSGAPALILAALLVLSRFSPDFMPSLLLSGSLRNCRPSGCSW